MGKNSYCFIKEFENIIFFTTNMHSNRTYSFETFLLFNISKYKNYFLFVLKPFLSYLIVFITILSDCLYHKLQSYFFFAKEIELKSITKNIERHADNNKRSQSFSAHDENYTMTFYQTICMDPVGSYYYAITILFLKCLSFFS